MTLLQKAIIACVAGSSAVAFAAPIPVVVPDNVVVCQVASGCTNKTLFGRSYKVITTPRFVVMVSISEAGPYTRADVSIANNTDMPQSISAEDFRVEVLSPKPRVLLYVAPGDLKLIFPAPPPSAVVKPAETVAPAPAAPDAAPRTLSIDELYAAAKKKAALTKKLADREAAQKGSCSEGGSAQTRLCEVKVFFERDRKAQVVKVVLPIAGLVFEFPYSLQP